MGNNGHDRKSGRFISKAQRRIQAMLHVADLTDDDYAVDEAAMRILDAGVARAIAEGWRPPAEVELEPQP